MSDMPDEISEELIRRIAVAANELQEQRELWSTTIDGEIVIDTEVIAAIVIRSFIEEEVGANAQGSE